MSKGGIVIRDENRCVYVYRDTPKARERGKVGERCGMPRANETAYCKFHGGNNQGTINAARRDRVEAEIRSDPAFTALWPEDHPKLDPFSLLLWEIRRAGQRIEWFDRRLSELAKDRDIWWGVTKKEAIGAAEYTGVNKTFEARENILVKMQNEERERLVKLRNEWQNNKFESARIAGMGAFRTAMTQALRAFADAFEIDLADPENAARLKAALADLPVPVPPMLETPQTESA